MPAAKTAEILQRKKVSTQDESRNLFADIQLKIGSMDILSDVMSVMDRECPPRIHHRQRLDDSSHDDSVSDHIDRNSLGNNNDYSFN